jgi:hypothetical protein
VPNVLRFDADSVMDARTGRSCLIGNCQAGWAVMMLAVTGPELFGSIVVPGSRLSCLTGIEGQNRMRHGVFKVTAAPSRGERYTLAVGVH